ncbi:MAG TPA: sulfatase [Candidatus Brocadiia bacterium]|nr:sulfatase [Candidatus Brocadiia bacterium]
MTNTRGITRRGFCASAVAGAFGLAAGRALGDAPAKRPNILLMTADDLGPYLGCYGDGVARTPVLDSLASEGMLFTRGYVTQASCSPSRSSILTGLYPHQNGQIGLAHRGYSMRPGMKTLPALLKPAGYKVGIVGKFHVAPTDAFPFDFEYDSPLLMVTRDVRKAAQVAGGFIRSARGEPFCLLVNFTDPHRPFLDQSAGLPQRLFQPGEVPPFGFLGVDSDDIRRDMAGYYNCMSRLDSGVGFVLDELRKSGHADDTLVVFISDHGPPFTRAKTTCYEAALRVPFIARWPGHAAPGTTSDRLVSTVDLLPTFLDVAGVLAPEGLAGASLSGILEGRDAPRREFVFGEFTSHTRDAFFPRRTIRDSRYRLIANLLPDRPNPVLGVDGCAGWKESRNDRWKGTDARTAMDVYHRPPPLELYDLESDPSELRNLAGRPEFAEIETKLASKLFKWRRETSDPLLDPAQLAALAREHDDGSKR